MLPILFFLQLNLTISLLLLVRPGVRRCPEKPGVCGGDAGHHQGEFSLQAEQIHTFPRLFLARIACYPCQNTFVRVSICVDIVE